MKFKKKKFIILVLVIVIVPLFVFSAKLFLPSAEQDSSRIKQIELPFKEKTYTLSYRDVNPDSVENISSFNASEMWKGSGFFDGVLYYEYPTSLTLAGSNANKITAARDVKLNLSRVGDFDLILNLRSDVNELEKASLIFRDENLKSARFVIPIRRNDWNIIRFTKDQFDIEKKFSWASITQVYFEFLPRPLGRVVVNLAGLRAQAELLQYNDWNISDKKFMIFDKREKIVNLMVRSVGKATVYATLRKITQAEDFNFQVTLKPLTSGWRGIFFRGNYSNGFGYYLMIKGIGGNQWTMYKNNVYGLKELITAVIPNFQFKPNEWYFLKVVVSGSQFKAYLSLDGAQYRELGEATDNEFRSGGVGIALNNKEVSLFNDFVFTQF